MARKKKSEMQGIAPPGDNSQAMNDKYDEERAQRIRDIVGDIKTAKQQQNDGQTKVARHYKRLEKECALEGTAAKTAIGLSSTEQNKRDIWLRDFNVTLRALGVPTQGVFGGMVSEAHAANTGGDLEEPDVADIDEVDGTAPDPAAGAEDEGLSAADLAAIKSLGGRACLDGQDATVCPYAEGTDAEAAWMNGYRTEEENATTGAPEAA